MSLPHTHTHTRTQITARKKMAWAQLLPKHAVDCRIFVRCWILSYVLKCHYTLSPFSHIFVHLIRSNISVSFISLSHRFLHIMISFHPFNTFFFNRIYTTITHSNALWNRIVIASVFTYGILYITSYLYCTIDLYVYIYKQCTLLHLRFP